jgi:parallel beta-helix repeat protein
MEKKALLTIALISMLLWSAIAGTLFARLASAQSAEIITIKDDGSIEPSTAPIRRVGDTYTLTGNIFDNSIVVQRSNIVIDGTNYLLQGERITGTDFYETPIGINLTKVSNVIIKNLEIKDFGKGVYLENASNCVIVNNTLRTTNGIALNVSSNNQITNNTITPNVDSTKTQNFGIFGLKSSNNNVSRNTVRGNGYEGVLIDGSNNNVDSNKVTEVGMGIEIVGSGNKVFGNEVFSTIRATSEEIFPNSGTGIGVGVGSNNQIFGNTIRDNGVGIGISGSGSLIYQNNFINNTIQVSMHESAKAVWDNGKEGNYWSDYLKKYPDAKEVSNTGIGNTPYHIDEDNVDNHPLMRPVDISLIPEFHDGTDEPEPYPTLLVVFVAVTVVVVVMGGLMVYFKKRKH